jgi:hypothetical protein
MVDVADILARRGETLADALEWPEIDGRRLRREYAAIEITLMEKFEKNLSVNLFSNVVEIYGFASRVGGATSYYIRPSLAVNYGVFCEAVDSRQLPTDFEFGRVRGYRVFRRKGGREADRWKLKDCSFEPVRIPIDNLKPESSLSDMEDSLWRGYIDPPRQIMRSALLAMTSAPAGMGRLGGLTTALMPTGEAVRGTQRVLLEDLKRAIPSDLTFESRIQISVERVGKFEIAPFPWSMKNLSSIARQERLLTRAGSKGSLEEVTLGFSASSSAPSSLGEIWMKNADFPVLVDGMLKRHSPPSRRDLNVAKFMITVHSLYPYAERGVEDNLLQLVQSRLVKMRKKYDPLGYEGVVDLDVQTGSPRLILGIAKSLARVEGAQQVSPDEVRNALEQFIDAREEIVDSWVESGYDYDVEHMPTELKLRTIGKTAQKIHRFLQEHPGSLGAEIRENLSRIQDAVFNRNIDEMLRLNLIYRTSSTEDRYSAV